MTNIKTRPSDILKDLIAIVNDQVDRFPVGSSQHTLQVNRLRALEVALAISQNESVSKEELLAAIAPLTSLISKSEKSLTTLDVKSWQAQRLIQNLSVLKPALSLVKDRLETKPEVNHD
jgi:hypothetical protein